MAVQSLFPILTTRDLPRLVEFYETALDAVIAFRFPGDDGDAYVSLAIGPAALGIGADPDFDQPVVDRVALWFYVDDVDETHRLMVDAGAESTREPTDMPWGERVGQVRDPDGNVINVAVPPATG